MILWVWAAVAHGHGGPPQSHALLWDGAGDMIIASSHGLIFEDDHWSWVCDEVFETALPTKFITTAHRIVVATTDGVAYSETGCEWTWSSDLSGLVVWEITTDIGDPNRIWAATENGMWRSDDHGSSFTFEGTPNAAASIRSFAQTTHDEFVVLGFIQGQATAWFSDKNDWSAIDLPVDGGRLHILGIDALGNTYARFPNSNGTDEMLRITPDGLTQSLIETDLSIRAFLSRGEVLLVSVDGQGTLSSLDGGQNWSLRSPQTVRCLVSHGEIIWGCPIDGALVMWLTADPGSLDDEFEWLDGAKFDSVQGPRCPEQLAECDTVWSQVAAELGVNSDEVQEPATDSGTTSSCLDVAPQNAVILLWVPSLWIYRRRLSSK